MYHRRENDACRQDDNKTAIKGVYTREEFASVCLRLFNGTHAPKNHRGVQERIDPRESFENVISEHPDKEGPYNQPKAKRSATCQAPKIGFAVE
jgi:hypothetical protein